MSKRKPLGPVETGNADVDTKLAEMEAAAAADAQGSLSGMEAFSDSWTAELVAGMSSDYVWTAGRGWLHYDQGVWCEVPEVTVKEYVRSTMHELWRHLANLPDANMHSLKAILKLTSASMVRNVFSLLPGMLEKSDALFDTDPWALCVGNGVVDLKSGVLGPWSKEAYFTRKTSVRYMPQVAHPDWEQALSALPLDEDRTWLQARLGQAATGNMAPDQIVISPGGGSNGKSTIYGAVRNALGSYAAVVPEQVLLAKEGAHPTELMTLRGVRFALIEELPEGKYLPNKRLKDLAGTPTISARKLYGDFTEFRASHSLFLTTNFQPLVAEVDTGTWRRLVKLSFPLRYVAPHKPLQHENDRHGDSHLRDRVLTGEAQQEAVLAWLVQGARFGDDILRRIPKRAQEETDAWEVESDHVLSFLTEHTEFDAGGMVSSQELFETFRQWMDARGHRGWTEATFSSRLTGHPHILEHRVSKKNTRAVGDVSRQAWGAPPYTQAQIKVWSGLRWKDSAPSGVPSEVAVSGVSGI